MASGNPYDASIAALIAQANDVRAAINSLGVTAQAHYARYMDWTIATPEGQDSWAAYNSLNAEIATRREQLKALEAELASQTKARDALNAAAAVATSNGMDPASAMQKAVADAQRKKVWMYVGVGVVVLAVIALTIWWWRKGKKKAA